MKPIQRQDNQQFAYSSNPMGGTASNRSLLGVFFETCLFQFFTASLKKQKITRMVKHNQEVNYWKYLANVDPLTGAFNRRFLYTKLERYKQATHSFEKFRLLYIDVDDFKSINDRFGHHVGDLALKAITEKLLKTVRVSDSVCRLGGDEFCVIVEGDESCKAANSIIERIRRGIESIELSGKETIRVSCSIGINNSVDLDASGDCILETADKDLIRNKQRKKQSKPSRFFQ